MSGDKWVAYGDQDIASGRLDASLYRTTRDGIENELTPKKVRDRSGRCLQAIENIATRLADMKPDLLVIVGDDQMELFLEDNIPAMAVLCAEEAWDRPPGIEAYPSGMATAYRYYHADRAERYAIASGLARHLVSSLVEAEFDIAITSVQHDQRGIGHAYTFVRLALTPDNPLPMVPVMLNTYFPPNQPTPKRCVAFGAALRNAIRTWDDDVKVVLVASGGLSHPIVDEDLDRLVLDSLASGDMDSLANLPTSSLYEGNSEIRNWIVVGSALTGANFELIDYVPGYRSVRGSGCGMAFSSWAYQ
jgi:hypothetical protein